MEIWDLYNCNREKIGKTIARGEKLADDEYHLVVNAWVKNKNGEFLITQRNGTRSHPYMWECTGGSAVTGETSIEAAAREVKEELGIDINKDTGKLVGSILRYYPNCPDILDVWIFEDETPIENVVYQEEEVCDAKWATVEEIKKMYDEGKFEANAYFEEVLALEDTQSVYYIGFNANNAICNDYFFSGSITLYPTKEKGNHCYSEVFVADTKSDEFMAKYREYIHNTAKEIQEKDNNARFICFNAKIKKLCEGLDDINIIKIDNYDVAEVLNNKFKTRELVKEFVPILEYIWIDGNEMNYQEIKSKVNSNRFVVQAPVGSGGDNTYLITSQEDIDKFVTDKNIEYCVSAYTPHIPLNATMIVGQYDIVSLPISAQLIMLTDNKFKYVGGDFAYAQQLEKDIVDKIVDYSNKIAKKVKEIGYRGILGIDYILNDKNEVIFMEINPRFQASSFLISMALNKHCNTDVAKLHYYAMNKRKLENPCLEKINGAFVNCNDVQTFDKLEDYEVLEKGYFKDNKSSVYRKIFNHSILYRDCFEKM